LIPLGLALVIRLIPSAVLAECRSAAADAFTPGNKPVSYATGAFIVMIWLTLAVLGMIWLYDVFADAPVSP
jgi:hypothetical protein